METYGKILLFAIPVFLVLVLLEKWYGWRKGNDTVKTLDMVSSIMSGITNVTKDVLGLSIAIYTYGWMVEHWAIIHIQSNIWTFVIAFIALDFAGYWVHRIAHTYNIFWNNHIVHHSSEEFNLACALRQSISSIFKIWAIFLLPAALLGVPEKVVAIVAPLHLFAQFWYHTQHINKMGWLENIIVTPSHHRVHHAINKEYLDKNFGQIFIFWDKWFGSYQEELKNVPPVYGITRPVHTWNPIKINFMHLGLLIKDAWRTKSWKDKFRIWLMPTGWRPADVAEKYPVFKIEDVYHFEKYDKGFSKTYNAFAVMQMFILLGFICFLFANIATIGVPGIFLYGVFIFIFVYALAELMDDNAFAWIWELIKMCYGISLLYIYPGWFGAGIFIPGAGYYIAAYLIVTFFAVWFLQFFNKQTVSPTLQEALNP